MRWIITDNHNKFLSSLSMCSIYTSISSNGSLNMKESKSTKGKSMREKRRKCIMVKNMNKGKKRNSRSVKKRNSSMMMSNKSD